MGPPEGDPRREQALGEAGRDGRDRGPQQRLIGEPAAERRERALPGAV